jgi:hypothetical protein
MRCKRLIYLGLKPLPSSLALVASFAQPRGQSSSGAQVIRLRHRLLEKQSPWVPPVRRRRFAPVAQLVPLVSPTAGWPQGGNLGACGPGGRKGATFRLEGAAQISCTVAAKMPRAASPPLRHPRTTHPHIRRSRRRHDCCLCDRADNVADGRRLENDRRTAMGR